MQRRTHKLVGCGALHKPPSALPPPYLRPPSALPPPLQHSMYEPQRWDAERKETEQVLRRISRFKPRLDMAAQHSSTVSGLGLRQQRELAPRPFHLPPLTHPGANYGGRGGGSEDGLLRAGPDDLMRAEMREMISAREMRQALEPPRAAFGAPVYEEGLYEEGLYEEGPAVGGASAERLMDDGGVPLREMELELRFALPEDADWAVGPWVRLRLMPRY